MQQIHGINPRTGRETGFVVTATSEEGVAAACRAAAVAAAAISSAPRPTRAGWLRSMADELEHDRDTLVAAADQETALGLPRLGGELARTCFQLRLFAEVVEEGSYLEATVDHAGDTAMGPRPDLRRMLWPIGPVAVFAASNFPFAFSVPGGDTAAALAAGCPVVVKAHPAHPQTSRLAYGALVRGLRRAGAPDGSLALVEGHDAGLHLVDDPAIRAVAFTGSAPGGRALERRAAARLDPIPFYGELSGLNPVVVTPSCAQDAWERTADDLAGAVLLGAGQFCTKPGLVLVPRGASGDALVARMARVLTDAGPLYALTAGIAAAYAKGVGELTAASGAEALVESEPQGEGFMVSAALVSVDARELEARALEECFGPAVVVGRYDDVEQIAPLLERVRGTLTATVRSGGPDDVAAAALAPALARVAGRVVWDGVPTGVAVAWAMQHGGPAPSTTNALHTSVGPTAVRRFLRPVTWQNAPEAVLPAELREDHTEIPRRVDGVLHVEGRPAR